MISDLVKKGTFYYCSNCQMRQQGIPHNCHFCGNWFSNYEETILKYRMEQYQAEIYRKKEELTKNESNL